MTWVRIGTMVVALALVGCSAEGEGKQDAAGAKPTTTLEASDTPSPSPTDNFDPNVGPRALRVGETRRGQDFTTRLVKLRYPYPPGQYREPDPGKQFLGINVRECMLPGAEVSGYDYSTNNHDWYAVSPNGNQVTGTGGWVDWPEPRFPENVTMNPGDCLKGWLTVQVPKGMKIKKVVYRPGGTTSAEWLP